MLITFKSRADGDVIMFAEVARRILSILGKDPADTRGIVTVEQIPAAIAALRAAVEEDRLNTPPAEEKDPWEQEPGTPRQAAPISLAQRAAPLLAMLAHSLKAATPVTWEA
ncbi:DUF1840 domain-containing protein [Uliginosibacterium paludis]|uniref:DUF1840 domain-containing protein n=1 Tax=Uliginosibacterium paludis TaxID=1615952 RepID=A0ABV2CSK4_9RHOO